MDRSEDWMRQATRDLQKSEADRAGGYHEWACFAAHQAAEKALKAVFQHLHQEAWGHALVRLVAQLPATIAVPPGTGASAQQLDQYYIPTRYPDAFPEGAPQDFYTAHQAEEAAQHARAIIRFCESLLHGS
ncbi:MAG: HEPN domain-containing protein [Candidatus Xenobia bacterium]